MAAPFASLREHGDGLLADLAFAVVWVAVVTALFGLLQGPTWAYHLSLAAGIPAYFGFHGSLAAARRQAGESPGA